jgi:cytoskeleton protein RodZ
VSKSQHSDTVVDAVESLLPGQVLQQAREQQGISLDQVSDRIKVSVTQLIALEQGDMDRLPGPAFARGYVRNYGRFLGLDADVLVNDFNVRYSGGIQRSVKSINRVKPQAHLGDPMIRVSVILFVMIILGSSVWWWQTQMGETTSLVGALSAVSSALVKPDEVDVSEEILADAENPLIVDEPVVRFQEADPIDGEAEPDASAKTANLQEAEAGTTPELTTPDLTGRATAEALPVVQDADEVQAIGSAVLVMRFNSECWVSIKDSNGEVIFASLMQDGNTLERNLDALPADLLIGQVGAVVESRFRGQPLDLAPHSKQGIARLTLK